MCDSRGVLVPPMLRSTGKLLRDREREREREREAEQPKHCYQVVDTQHSQRYSSGHYSKRRENSKNK